MSVSDDPDCVRQDCVHVRNNTVPKHMCTCMYIIATEARFRTGSSGSLLLR